MNKSYLQLALESLDLDVRPYGDRVAIQETLPEIMGPALESAAHFGEWWPGDCGGGFWMDWEELGAQLLTAKRDEDRGLTWFEVEYQD